MQRFAREARHRAVQTRKVTASSKDGECLDVIIGRSASAPAPSEIIVIEFSRARCAQTAQPGSVCKMTRKSIVEGHAAVSVGCDRRARGAIIRRVHRMQVVRQLIGKVSHDLDARLHSVLSALDVMHKEIDQNKAGELGSLVDAAAMSLHQAALLSRQLMTVSRPRKYEPAPVSVNAVIASMTVLLRSMIGFRVEVEINLGKNLPNVLCDPGHLETVLFNLALDARNAIAGPGKVMIETCFNSDLHDSSKSPAQAFLQICVVDTGEVDPVPAMTTTPCRRARAASGFDSRASVEMARHFAAGLHGRVVVDRHPESGTAITMLLPLQRDDYGKRNLVPDLPRSCAHDVRDSALYSAIPPLPEHGLRMLHRP
jgi:hypothetical protein